MSTIPLFSISQVGLGFTHTASDWVMPEVFVLKPFKIIPIFDSLYLSLILKSLYFRNVSFVLFCKGRKKNSLSSHQLHSREATRAMFS